MSDKAAPNTPKQQQQKQGGQNTPGQKKPQTPQNKPNTPKQDNKQQGGDNKQQNKPNTPKQDNKPQQKGGDNKPQQQQQKGGDNKPQQQQKGGDNKQQQQQPKQQQKGGDNKPQQQQQKGQQKGGDNKQQIVKADQNGAKKVKPTPAEEKQAPIVTPADDFPTSSFWAIEVEPKKAFTQTLTFPVKIKQAVIGHKAGSDDKEPNILYAVVESKKWPIAVLSNAIPQQTLNIAFDAETSLTFLSSGSSSIFVYGNYYPNEDYDDDSDDEGYPGYDDYDSEDDDDDEHDHDDEDDDDDEDDESDDEISEKIAQAALKRKAAAAAAQNSQKKPKQNEPEEKPKAKQPEAKQQESKSNNDNKSADGYQTLKNGLKFQDITVGKGSKPTPGKQVTVSYVGRLTNGKVFDRSNSFAFRLGIGEVIKGWDLGVATMQVGSKRRLVIPPQLGYGARGAPPDIPGNATLIFDVELKKA